MSLNGEHFLIFITCGFAISSCGLTSIFAIPAISATPLGPQFFFSVTDSILEHKKQKTGIGEQLYTVQL